MSLAFAHPDDGGRTTTAVWEDAARTSVLFADALHVNTDGTRRSYSVSDFWGKVDAINTLCNAMSDACRDLTPAQREERRVLTQRARAEGWPREALAATRIARSIIPLKDGKPCPEVDGVLGSATALQRRGVADPCDLRRYVDALTTPAIVLPGRGSPGAPTGFEARNARIGDLAVVASPDLSVVVYAVVGDIGPARELGEGSVALAGALLGKTHEPANYLEIRGRAPYQGKGWEVPRAFVLVFPGTRDDADPYLTRPRIDRDAQAAFERWGGVARLTACSAVYRRR